MTVYHRPLLAAPTIRDRHGAPIPFGRRWGQDGPPAESYSVTSHRQRFAALHVVADALIAHLIRTYVVTAEDVDADRQPFGTSPRILRSISLTPAGDRGAPLLFGFTDFPGIRLRSGALGEAVFPACGCDACDETWSDQAERLEREVLTVAGGGLDERVTDRRVSIAYTYPDGSSASEESVEDYSASDLDRARGLLAAAPGGWEPWPRR